jgi:hypothetical protein
MKHISLTLLIAITVLFCNAQAIKVTTYNSKVSPNKYTNTMGHEMGTPASVITQKEFGGAWVYWKVDILNYKAIKAKYRLDIKVMQVKDGQESLSYKNEMYIPTKNGWQFLFSEFTEGTYNIYVRDQDNPEDVYSKATFTVPAIVKPDYKHNSTLVVCKSIDDSWNAVGATEKVKAGECMNFLYKAKDKIQGTVLTWNVVKINADGNEDYITHLIQGTQGKPFRYLGTNDGVCVFTTPGKYRVYLFERDNYDTQINRNENNSNYLGRTEITVE